MVLATYLWWVTAPAAASRTTELGKSRTGTRPLRGRSPSSSVGPRRAKEVSDTLAALSALRPRFETLGGYGAVVADQVFSTVRKTIVREKEKTVYSIAVDGSKPADLCLLLISNAASNELLSGDHHVYRGVVSGEGRGYLGVFERSVEGLEESGAITTQEARADVAAVLEGIKGAG